MFSKKSHFLVMKVPDTSGGQEVVAFSHFQFVWDDEDEPEHPVLYCFELHVSEQHQVSSRLLVPSA